MKSTHFNVVRAGVALVLAASLGGCGNLAGVGGGDQFGCKAPVGVRCDSMSGVYANSVQNNLPSQRAAAARAGTAQPAPSRPATAHGAVQPRQVADATGALRSDGRVLRLWINAWEDQERDLVDQSYVYVRVDDGRWLVDHAQARVRDAYAPLRPVADGARASSGAARTEPETQAPVPVPQEQQPLPVQPAQN